MELKLCLFVCLFCSVLKLFLIVQTGLVLKYRIIDRYVSVKSLPQMKGTYSTLLWFCGGNHGLHFWMSIVFMSNSHQTKITLSIRSCLFNMLIKMCCLYIYNCKLPYCFYVKLCNIMSSEIPQISHAPYARFVASFSECFQKHHVLHLHPLLYWILSNNHFVWSYLCEMCFNKPA